MEFDLEAQSDGEIPMGQPHPERRGESNPDEAQPQREHEDQVEVLRPWLHDSERRLGRDHPEVTRIREMLRKATEKKDRQKLPEDKLQILKDRIRNQEEKLKEAEYFLELKEGQVKKVTEERDTQMKEYEEAKAELESSKAKKQELLETIAKQNPAAGNSSPPTMVSITETLKGLAMNWPRNQASPPIQKMMDEFAQHLLRITTVMEELSRAEATEAADPEPGSDVEMGTKTAISRGKKATKQAMNERSLRRGRGDKDEMIERTASSSQAGPTPCSTPRARKAPDPVDGTDEEMALKTRRGDENGGVLVTSQGNGQEPAGGVKTGQSCP